jgi:hypothetical protein
MSRLDAFLAIIWPAFLLIQLGSMRFIYWDVDELAIHEHRFGKQKRVPFSQILKVTGRAEWSAKVSQLKIRYASHTNPSKHETIHPAPADMDAFVDLLRQRVAPAGIDF